MRHHQVCTKIYLVVKGGFVCRYRDEKLEIEKTINFFFPDFHPFMTCIDSFFGYKADEGLHKRTAPFLSDKNLAKIQGIRVERDPNSLFYEWHSRPDLL